MSDLNPPVTYIRDPALVPPLTPVFLVSGSIALNLAPGDIQIGNVGITDDVSGLNSEVQKANAAKSTGNNVLLVQSIDLNGEVLAKDDILNLDAGVDVLIAGQAQAQATITALLNSQGTQSTAGLATAGNQTTGNSTLTVISDRTKAVNDTGIAILNNQGTLATSANQVTANNTLATQNQILASIASSGTTTPLTATLLDGVTTPGASVNVDVSAYMHHTFQHVISGSVVVQTRASLNGVNWNIEDETNQSGMVDLSGKTKFVSVNVVYIDGSVTTLLMSGN